jgi:hypothetical protein
MNIAQQLRRWADGISDGQIQQVHGGTQQPHHACVVNAWIAIASRDLDIPGIPHPPVCEVVAREVNRLTGREMPLSLISQNDTYKVPFAVFAAAMRNVAYRLEEQDAGEPIEQATGRAFLKPRSAETAKV